MSSPPLLVPRIVELFFEGLGQGFYPYKNIEKIFGVEMTESSVSSHEVLNGTQDMDQYISRMLQGLQTMPIGRLVFNIWMGFFKIGFLNQNEMTQSLTKGTFPQYFENCVQKQNEMCSSSYIKEILRRGFSQIPWDRASHCRLAVLANTTTLSCCKTCGKSEQSLFRCSVCRSVTYCSKKCQKTNWQDHKLECIPYEQ
jgi:hypothetical protein